MGNGQILHRSGLSRLRPGRPCGRTLVVRGSCCNLPGVGHQRGIAKVLEGFAYVAAHQNNAERALTLAGAASSLRQTLGAPRRRGGRSWTPPWRRRGSIVAPKQHGRPGGECALRTLFSTLWQARHKVGDVYSKFAGSTIRRTAATRSTRPPINRACSRIRSSSGA